MTIVEAYHEDASRVLDRLVDGELSQTDRRMLLAALDDEPEGWRRCALAFLENQSWRWQLAQVAAEPMVAQASAESLEPNVGQVADFRGGSRSVGRGMLWGLCLVSAASVLVAFALGTQYGGTTRRMADLPNPAGSDGPNVVLESVATPTVGATGSAEEWASKPEADRQVASAATQSEGSSPWETLTLAPPDDGPGATAASPIQLRVRDAESDSLDLQQLLVNESSALPAMLVSQLEEEGWTVTRKRHLVPVDLSDGRRMVMPVEQVDLRPPDFANL